MEGAMLDGTVDCGMSKRDGMRQRRVTRGGTYATVLDKRGKHPFLVGGDHDLAGQVGSWRGEHIF